MKNLRKYAYALAVALVAITTACEDQSEEITELDLSRPFSATGAEARVQNQTGVKITWTSMASGATYNVKVFANDSCSYEFTGSAVAETTVTTNTASFEGLEGETQHTAYIQTVVDNVESSWIGVVFTTGSSQYFETVLDEEIGDTYVTLRWKAGIEADKITLKCDSSSKSYELTSEDLANAYLYIEGLLPETDYKATLKNGTKTVGTISFTTQMDLSGADAVLKDGDDLVAAIEALEDGAVIALQTGTFGIPSTSASNGGTLALTKSISIKAANSTAVPVIDGRISLAGGASLSLSGLVINGSNTDGGQMINYVESGVYASLVIENCEVYGNTKGLIYGASSYYIQLDELIINNCLFHDIETSGGDFIDFRGGGWNSLEITNSTFYSCFKSRDFLRCDNTMTSTEAAGYKVKPVSNISNCTFYNCGSGGAGYRMFYVRYGGGADISASMDYNYTTFKKCVVSGFNNTRGFTNSSNTGIDENSFGNNYYYNCSNLQSLADGNTETPLIYDTKGTTLSADPFTDAANGDFTVTNEDIIYYEIGDPRWIK